jgi:hypothetical protein
MAAWEQALERFRGGYGHEPDFEDQTDQRLYLQLLEEEVHIGVEAKLAEAFQEATRRMEAVGR